MEQLHCEICGKPVIDGENGFEDDGGMVFCDECADEVSKRYGELLDQMKKEKRGTSD